MDLKDYLEIIVKRKRIILFVSICVIIGYSMFFFTQTPSFTARSRVLLRLPPEWQDMPVISMPSWETRISLASSQPVLQRTSKRLKKKDGIKISPGQIRAGLSVSPERNTDFVDLRYTNKKAEHAKKVLSVLTQIFLQYDQENNQKSLENARKVLREELDKTQERIVTREKRVEDLDQLHSISNTIVSTSKKLDELKRNYGPNHPKRKVVQEQLTEAQLKLRSNYQKLFQDEYDPDDSMEDLIVNNLDVRRANEELNRAKDRYDELRRNLDQVRFNRSLLGQSGSVTAEPTSVSKSYPTNYKTYGFVILAGMILGIATGAFLEFIDDRIVSKFDIHRYLGLKVLGSIPQVGADETNLIESPEKTPLSERYHSISALLEYSLLEDSLGKAIQVTSTTDGEGKTTTALNLGVSLARQGEKVLLVDMDLREPELHHVFGLMNSEGSSSILTGSLELEHAVQNPSSGNREGFNWESVSPLIENTPQQGLDVLSSGPLPSNPIKALKSDYVPRLISTVKKEYGITILDTPPIQAVIDPIILSTKVNGVILVVKSESTNRGDAQHAKHLLEDVEAEILGAVLNGMKREIPEYYEYYGQT